MKKLTLLLTVLLIPLGTTVCFAKKVKITCDQEDAKIYVDNDYVAKGSHMAEFKKKEGHIRVRIEKEGYVTRRFKIKSDDKRKSIDIILDKDDAYIASNKNELANKYFTINVDQKFLSAAGGQKEAAELAWKQLHQILMNYIEEVEESNMLGGYIQSAWTTKTFVNSSLNDIEGGIKWRTRVTIKEISDGTGLAYRVKISSEVAPMNATSDEYYQPTERILKSFEPMISEFQARLGSY